MRVADLGQEQGRGHLGEAVSEAKQESTGDEDCELWVSPSPAKGGKFGDDLRPKLLANADRQPPRHMKRHPVMMAILRPKWSATKGVMKKLTMEPMFIMFTSRPSLLVSATSGK